MNDVIGTLLLLLYLVGGLLFMLLRVLLVDMRLWIALTVFLAWILLRGRREKGLALLVALGAALIVHGFNISGGKELCMGQGYLDATGKVRLWRAAVMQRLTGEPRAPWCDETAGREKCPWLRRWRGPAAPEAQVALVREAFRLVETCARERGDAYRCRQLLREDDREACTVLDCKPDWGGPRPWFFRDSPIRAIIFALSHEGTNLDFRVYVDDAHTPPFTRPAAPGHALAWAATLHFRFDEFTDNLCPTARVEERTP